MVRRRSGSWSTAQTVVHRHAAGSPGRGRGPARGGCGVWMRRALGPLWKQTGQGRTGQYRTGQDRTGAQHARAGRGQTGRPDSNRQGSHAEARDRSLLILGQPAVEQRAIQGEKMTRRRRGTAGRPAGGQRSGHRPAERLRDAGQQAAGRGGHARSQSWRARCCWVLLAA